MGRSHLSICSTLSLRHRTQVSFSPIDQHTCTRRCISTFGRLYAFRCSTRSANTWDRIHRAWTASSTSREHANQIEVRFYPLTQDALDTTLQRAGWNPSTSYFQSCRFHAYHTYKVALDAVYSSTKELTLSR